MRAILGLALALIAMSSFAEEKLYRYVDANGGVHYTDQPPSKGAKPLVLDSSRAPVAKRKWDDAASVEIIRQAVRFAVQWTLPSPGQIYHANDGDLQVIVSVMPGLAKGFGINFQVDGKTQNSRPIKDIQATLHGIGAGKHELLAALISPDGKELARSVPISIEIKPALPKN